MVRGRQTLVGLGSGLLGLIVVFGVLYTWSGRGDIAVDGSQVESVDGPDGDATDGSDVLGDVAASAGDDTVRSFVADGSGSAGQGESGLALRVVTDGDSGTSSTMDASTSTSTTAPVTTSSSTTAAPTTAAPTTATDASSSTTPTTAASSSTTAAPPSTSEDMTTTTKADASTSPSTATTAAPTTAAPTTDAPTTRPPTSAPGSGSNARTYEQEVIRLTNNERAAGGCGPLTNNDKLHAAALGHSTDMANNDYFSHTGRDGSSMSDRIDRQGYQWRSLAENIAAGYRSPEAVVDGWMNSSGHRRNIMNCNLTEIGVGFHNYYWTQNFGTPR